MRIIPPGMPWIQALRRGYVGEIRMPQYVDWIKTLPCHNCHRDPPSDPSHGNFLKSQRNKCPDPLTLPECRMDHELYERSGVPDEQRRLAIAAIHMLQAIAEGRLVWKSTKERTMEGIGTIGWAIKQLYAGEKVRRAGWNGKNMFLLLVPGSHVPLREGTPYHAALNSGGLGQSHVTIGAHIDMYTAQGIMQPGWLASQADLLATDWEIA